MPLAMFAMMLAMGLTLGPVTGKLIEGYVLEGRTSLPAGALGLERLK